MWSNCVIEAVKAIWRNPYNRVYLVLRLNWEYFIPEVHCYWFDFKKMRYYHFSPVDCRLPYLEKFWHKGRITQFKHHRYSKSRRIW